MITGETRVAGVIGDPVRQSLSPVLHQAAYAALGLDWVYVAFEVAAGSTPSALAAVRDLHLVGVSVTMPHKEAAVGGCDELSDHAARLRSVNTVTRLADGRLHGDSTDGEGFLRSLRDGGHEVAGRSVVVLGAGGAARAVAAALVGEGAQVCIAARRRERAIAAAELSGAAAVAWGDRDDAARASDVLVNATPVGMAGAELPVDPAVLHAGAVVADLVYHPRPTPLLAAAAAAGAATCGGLGMLVHQAALQVERWAGMPAPLAAMRTAVEAALRAR